MPSMVQKHVMLLKRLSTSIGIDARIDVYNRPTNLIEAKTAVATECTKETAALLHFRWSLSPWYLLGIGTTPSSKNLLRNEKKVKEAEIVKMETREIILSHQLSRLHMRLTIRDVYPRVYLSGHNLDQVLPEPLQTW